MICARTGLMHQTRYSPLFLSEIESLIASEACQESEG